MRDVEGRGGEEGEMRDEGVRVWEIETGKKKSSQRRRSARVTNIDSERGILYKKNTHTSAT